MVPEYFCWSAIKVLKAVLYKVQFLTLQRIEYGAILPPVSSRSPRPGATNDFCFPGLISFAIEQSLHKSSCHHFKYFIFFSYLFKQRKSVALSFLLDSEMFSTVFVSLLEFKSSSKQKKYSLVFGLFLPPI